MDGGGFIRELCLALEHRWEPEELFLLFTAYFDEADTHGGAPTIIMAAFLGAAANGSFLSGSYAPCRDATVSASFTEKNSDTKLANSEDGMTPSACGWLRN